MTSSKSKVTSVATCRMTVHRANGDVEVYYDQEHVPLWQVRRKIKAMKHLRFMKNEDKELNRAH